MTDLLWEMVMADTDALKAQGIPLPDELKLRDRREPHRKQKLKLEDKITLSTKRHFKRQETRIKERIELWYPSRKEYVTRDWLDDALNWDDDDYIRELIKLLTQAAQDGVLGRRIDRRGHVPVQGGRVVHDGHGTPAEHIRRPHQNRVADPLSDLQLSFQFS